MGDTRSWLIFLVGALAVSIVAFSILIAAVIVVIRRVGQKRLKQTQTKATKTKRVDTVADRRRDNKIQAYTILIVVIICATIGVAISLYNPEISAHWIGGAAIGSFAGLVIGLVVGGGMIMLIRSARANKKVA